MNTWQRLRAFRSVVKLQVVGRPELRARAPPACCPGRLAQLGDARRLHVEADGLEVLAELHRERQPDVTETDDADATLSQF